MLFFQAMKVVVIGGTGFIGTHVVRALLRRNTDVVLFTRSDIDGLFPEERVYHIHGDKEDIIQYRKVFRMLEPDVVIDMISFTFQDAWNTLQAFEDAKPRMVGISSSDVYRAYEYFRSPTTDQLEPLPLKESAPYRETLYPYRYLNNPRIWDYDKIPVEALYQNAFERRNTILRLSAVYGPGDRQLRLKEPISRILDGRRFILLNEAEADWRWTWGYVENVAEAIAQAALSPKAEGKIYNVGEERAHSVYEWVVRIANAMDWKLEVVKTNAKFLPNYQKQPFNYRQHLVMDTSSLREDIGFSEPVGSAEAIEKTIEYQRWYFSKDKKPIPWDYRLEDKLYHKAYKYKFMV